MRNGGLRRELGEGRRQEDESYVVDAGDCNVGGGEQGQTVRLDRALPSKVGGAVQKIEIRDGLLCKMIDGGPEPFSSVDVATCRLIIRVV